VSGAAWNSKALQSSGLAWQHPQHLQHQHQDTWRHKTVYCQLELLSHHPGHDSQMQQIHGVGTGLLGAKGKESTGVSNICGDRRQSVLAQALMHATGTLLTCVISSPAPPPALPRPRGAMGLPGSWGPKNIQNTKVCCGFFRTCTYSIRLTEFSVLWNLEVTSLIIIWGHLNIASHGRPLRVTSTTSPLFYVVTHRSMTQLKTDRPEHSLFVSNKIMHIQ
jgi:hypothetical protein